MSSGYFVVCVRVVYGENRWIRPQACGLLHFLIFQTRKNVVKLQMWEYMNATPFWDSEVANRKCSQSLDNCLHFSLQASLLARQNEHQNHSSTTTNPTAMEWVLISLRSNWKLEKLFDRWSLTVMMMMKMGDVEWKMEWVILLLHKIKMWTMGWMACVALVWLLSWCQTAKDCICAWFGRHLCHTSLSIVAHAPKWIHCLNYTVDTQCSSEKSLCHFWYCSTCTSGNQEAEKYRPLKSLFLILLTDLQSFKRHGTSSARNWMRKEKKFFKPNENAPSKSVLFLLKCITFFSSHQYIMCTSLALMSQWVAFNNQQILFNDLILFIFSLSWIHLIHYISSASFQKSEH